MDFREILLSGCENRSLNAIPFVSNCTEIQFSSISGGFANPQSALVRLFIAAHLTLTTMAEVKD
jgi:hypothetical protein